MNTIETFTINELNKFPYHTFNLQTPITHDTSCNTCLRGVKYQNFNQCLLFSFVKI